MVRTAVIVAVSVLAGMGLGVQAMPEPQPVPPQQVLTCDAGTTEDSCYPDYIGGGRWVIRSGEPTGQGH